MRKRVCGFIFAAVILTTIFGLRVEPEPVAVPHAVAVFKQDAVSFALSTGGLVTALKQIDKAKPVTVLRARAALLQCRLRYKSIAYFLDYFFSNAAMVYNAAPKTEVEEPSLEYTEPHGMQVIEALLFEKNVAAKKRELLEQAELINSSAQDILSLLYNFNASDSQLLESTRLELIRVMALGISGYDAPLLKSGITEAAVSIQAIQQALQPLLNKRSAEADTVSLYLKNTIAYLKINKDFNAFNRLAFLVQYALPLQRHLGAWGRQMHLQLNTSEQLNDAADLFSRDAIKQDGANTGDTLNNKRANLGKLLFAENALSGNDKRSCQTCHRPENYFTDNLPASLAINGHSHVKRNAPTLLYAGFQRVQFWDGRVKTLDEQVENVIASPLEMNGNYTTVVQRLNQKTTYQKLFKQAFPAKGDTAISINNVAASIAAYIRTLAPMNSPFDRYMHGNRTALTARQKSGFNLFMGKAQCGTCHFMPLFNGLIPPLYQVSEFEVLGTPRSANFNKIKFDTDSGRHNVYAIPFYIGAFKTPTVRNSAKTAPYMHNGSLPTLAKVLEFYNRGGGAGLGLTLPSQTLPPDSLKLSKNEISNIILFLNALTDN